MENELEYTISVKEEKEFSSLYSHYIAEIDEKGNEVQGIHDKWIPFHHSIHFVTKSISYSSNLSFEEGIMDAYDEEEETKKKKTKKKISEKDFHVDFDENEYIYAELKIAPDEELSFLSMFGTERRLKDISMRISQGEQDSCRLVGIPSYESEGPHFDKFFTDDALQIILSLKEEKFRKLVSLVCENNISSFPIRLGQVAGLYAPWSPTYVSSAIKVLSTYHELDDPKNLAPHFRSLGAVREINISPVISQDLSVSKGIADEIEETESLQGNRASDDTETREVKGYSKPESDDITWKFVGFGVVILLLLIFSNS